MLKVSHIRQLPFQRFLGQYYYCDSSPEEKVNVIDKIQCDEGDIDCAVNENQQSVLCHDGCIHESIKSILSSSPKLKRSPTVVAKALNYLVNGTDYKLIEDPKQFKQDYDYFYQYGKSPLTPLSAYDHFDTSGIEKPKIEHEKLTFYVERNTVPYQVSCQLPIDDNKPLVKMEMLNPID